MSTMQQSRPTTATAEGARRFAATLADSEPARAFSAAQDAMATSEPTQALLQSYREAHAALGWRARSGALEPAEQEQLADLQQLIESDPHIVALQQAQDAVRAACQDAADVLSATAGIDLATSCGSGGCC